jgi:peroxiredoxin
MKKEIAGQGKRRTPPAVLRRVAISATLGVVALGTAAAIVLWGMQRNAATQPVPAGTAASVTPLSGAVGSPAPSLPAGMSPAEAALAEAAEPLKFHLTTDTNVGIIEMLPADTTLLPPSRSMLAVGKMAPDFSLQTPLGETMRLSDYRGKTVLLEFFATWCPHCQAEALHLRNLYATLSPDSFAFLSVNADGEDTASLYAFHRFFAVPWPVLLDPATPAGSFLKSGAAGAVTRAYGVALYPAFYIIDARGRIAWRNDREQPDLLLTEQLQHASERAP